MQDKHRTIQNKESQFLYFMDNLSLEEQLQILDISIAKSVMNKQDTHLYRLIQVHLTAHTETQDRMQADIIKQVVAVMERQDNLNEKYRRTL